MKRDFSWTCLPWLVLNPFVLEELVSPQLLAQLYEMQS